MVKVKGPLYSLGAQKSVGKSVTFKKIKGRVIAQKYFIPKIRYTEDQVKVRATFDSLIFIYQTLNDAEKESWNRYAKIGLRGQITGQNAFVKHNFIKYYKTGEWDEWISKEEITRCYINQAGATAWHGRDICINPSLYTYALEYTHYRDIEYTPAQKNIISTDDGDYAQSTLTSTYGAGFNCGGLARAGLPCSSYDISQCPFYLSELFYLWYKCGWYGPPVGCVTMYPCKNYGGEQFEFQLFWPGNFKSIEFTIKVGKSAHTPTFYFMLWNYTTEKFEAIASNTTGIFTFTTTDEKYISAEKKSIALITGSVTGGRDYYMRSFFAEAKIISDVPRY